LHEQFRSITWFPPGDQLGVDVLATVGANPIYSGFEQNPIDPPMIKSRGATYQEVGPKKARKVHNPRTTKR